MTRTRKRYFFFPLILLLLIAAGFAYKKRDSITWRFKMYTGRDITSWSVRLDDSIKETSGLLWWNGLLWTMKDHSEPKLYALDPRSGKVVRWIRILNSNNFDWEDLAQDDKYFYIGDFGDNSALPRVRERTIFMVPKEKLAQTSDSIMADTLRFTFEGWYNDRQLEENNTNFDCEAMIAYGDSLYLFTKQWRDEKTTVYALPKKPGRAVARRKYVYNIGALLTGANYMPEKNLLLFTGYHTDMRTYLTPFVYLVTGFNGDDFFSGSMKKVYLGKPFHQVESVATPDGKTFYFTSEALSKKGIGLPAMLMRADLTPYLPPGN